MGDNESGCLGIFAIIAQIAVFVFSGILAWNLIGPNGFFGALLFLLVWGIIEAAGYFLVVVIFAGLASLFGDGL